MHHVSGWKTAALWLLGLVLRGWGRTLRVRVDAAQLAAAARGNEPVAFVFWHNRLFFATRLLRLSRPGRTIVGLVSASRDGAVLAKFLSFLGVRTVRGSSSRYGREAVHQLVEALKSGYDIVVTPDGPRGPVYNMKPGAVLAARRANTALVLVGIECRACFALRSWDRFLIPLPGARVLVRCERIEPADLAGESAATLAQLRARLLALNGEPPAPGAEAT